MKAIVLSMFGAGLFLCVSVITFQIAPRCTATSPPGFNFGRMLLSGCHVTSIIRP